MRSLNELQQLSGILLTESKYGTKFDNFKCPFKSDGKRILDKTGLLVAECGSIELAKELAAILDDIRKLREICERITSLPKQ